MYYTISGVEKHKVAVLTLTFVSFKVTETEQWSQCSVLIRSGELLSETFYISTDLKVEQWRNWLQSASNVAFSWYLPAVPPFNIETKKAPFRCLFSQNPPESRRHILVHSVSKDKCLLSNFTLQWEKSKMRCNRLSHLWPADIDILVNRLIQPDFKECLVRS